jgi:hypothetical protein
VSGVPNKLSYALQLAQQCLASPGRIRSRRRFRASNEAVAQQQDARRGKPEALALDKCSVLSCPPLFETGATTYNRLFGTGLAGGEKVMKANIFAGC